MGQKLDEIMKNVNKRYKEEIISHGLSDYSYKRIPFTSPRMNYCTFGGLPVGKIIEFYGEEHGGKTTSALDIVANYQRSGDDRAVLYVDAVRSVDSDTFALGNISDDRISRYGIAAGRAPDEKIVCSLDDDA